MPTSIFAQWTGSGAGGAGTDFNDVANWAGGSVTGNFSGNTSGATVALSANSPTLSVLNFNWGTANTFNLTGNGTGANEVIRLDGDILLSRAAGTSAVTIASDVTIDYGTGFTALRKIQYGSTGTGTSSLVINGMIAGTAGTGGSLSFAFNTTNPVVSLNNTGSTFSAPIRTEGLLYYTSIGNVGGGASALGAPTTAAHGTITVASGASLRYTGVADTSSDRNISFPNSSASAVVNGSSTATTQVFTGTFTAGTGTNTTLASVNAASRLDVQGVFSGVNMRVNFDTDQLGIVRLSNAANTYTGNTTIRRGTLEVATLADGGQPSSLGTSSNAAANLLIRGDANAVLKYVGAGSSTDRLFTIWGNSTVDASGTGAVKFTNTNPIVFGSAGSATNLILTGSSTDANTLAPTLSNNGAAAVSLFKRGAGTWVLNGANTYTGSTGIQAGTLIVANTDVVSGSATGSGAVSLAAASTLGGAGRVAGLVTAAGATSRFAPGAIGEIGTLHLHGGLSAAAGATFDYQISGTSVDAVDFGSGPLTLGGSVTLNFTSLGSIEPGRIYQLFAGSGAWSGTPSFTLNMLSSDYTADLSYGSGAGYVWDSANHSLSVRFASAIPEPSTWASIVGAFALATATVRRRRRSC